MPVKESLRGKNRIGSTLFCAKEIYYIKLNTKEIEQLRMLDSITLSYLHLLPKKINPKFYLIELFYFLIAIFYE